MPNFKIKLLFAGLHAIFLLLFAFFLQYTSYSRADENNFLKMYAIIKHDLLKLDPKPVKDSVVFIDISKDIRLIPDTINKYADTIGNFKLESSKIVITDRLKLAWLFNLLNNHAYEYKYILCDLYFECPSPDDPALNDQFKRNKKCIVSAQLSGTNLNDSLFEVKRGLVDYASSEANNFTKILIFNQHLKTLPVLMLEDLTRERFSEGTLFTFQNNRLAFNSVIPEYFYRGIQHNNRCGPKLLYLYQLFVPGSFDKFLKDKYIVIGDFGGADDHMTYEGKLSGALILFNSFLTLKTNSAVPSPSWYLVLFTCFLLVSYYLFWHSRSRPHKPVLHIGFLKEYWVKYVSYLGVFMLVDLISFIFFKKIIGILYMVTYLTTLDFLLEKRYLYKHNRSLIKTFTE